MKKREKKLEHKEKAKQLHPEDKKIVQQLKNKKRKERKERTTEADDFDKILETYKKKLKTVESTGGSEFEEVSV